MKIKIPAALTLIIATAGVAGILIAGVRDYSTIEAEVAITVRLNSTATWGPVGFDEAAWLAVERMAALEQKLPSEVEEYRITVRPSNEADLLPVHLHFSRADLRLLMSGVIAPEVFMRERVVFGAAAGG